MLEYKVLVQMETVASIGASIVTIVGLAIIAYQIRDSKRSNRAQFVNDLDIDSTRHSPIYSRLLPGGDWFENKEPSVDHTEFVALLEYLGFYEKLHLLMQNRAIDLSTADRLFGGRFIYTIDNPYVRRMVLKSAEFSEHFKCVRELEPVWREFRRRPEQKSFSEQSSPTCPEGRTDAPSGSAEA